MRKVAPSKPPVVVGDARVAQKAGLFVRLPARSWVDGTFEGCTDAAIGLFCRLASFCVSQRTALIPETRMRNLFNGDKNGRRALRQLVRAELIHESDGHYVLANAESLGVRPEAPKLHLVRPESETEAECPFDADVPMPDAPTDHQIALMRVPSESQVRSATREIIDESPRLAGAQESRSEIMADAPPQHSITDTTEECESPPPTPPPRSPQGELFGASAPTLPRARPKPIESEKRSQPPPLKPSGSAPRQDAGEGAPQEAAPTPADAPMGAQSAKEAIRELEARYGAPDTVADVRMGLSLFRCNGKMADTVWLNTLRRLATLPIASVMYAFQQYLEHHYSTKNERYLFGIARGAAERNKLGPVSTRPKRVERVVTAEEEAEIWRQMDAAFGPDPWKAAAS